MKETLHAFERIRRPRTYTLPPEEMAAILELLEGIWYHYDLDDDGPFIYRLPERRSEAIDVTSGDTTGLSGSHVGCIYRAISYCAGQFGRPCNRRQPSRFSMI